MVRLACSVPPDRSEGGAVGRMIGEGGGGGGGSKREYTMQG